MLDVVDKVHTPIFVAIHEQGRNLGNPQAIAQIFEAEAGVNPKLFSDTFNSFSVQTMVHQAQAKARAYRVIGVPTLIVEGKYRVDGRTAGNNTRMLDVADHLIEQSGK